MTADNHHSPAEPLGWFGMFTAMLGAVIVGGLILFFCFRAYVHYSVHEARMEAAEAMKELMDKQKDKQK